MLVVVGLRDHHSRRACRSADTPPPLSTGNRIASLLGQSITLVPSCLAFATLHFVITQVCMHSGRMSQREFLRGLTLFKGFRETSSPATDQSIYTCHPAHRPNHFRARFPPLSVGWLKAICSFSTVSPYKKLDLAVSSNLDATPCFRH